MISLTEPSTQRAAIRGSQSPHQTEARAVFDGCFDPLQQYVVEFTQLLVKIGVQPSGSIEQYLSLAFVLESQLD